MRRWRKRRECMHGQPGGASAVTGHLIDVGRRKLFECGNCGKRWVA